MASDPAPRRLGVGAAAARLGWATGIALVAPLSLYHAALLAESVATPNLAWVLPGLVLGALAADFVTGLVHWACDTWGSERTRVLGPALIRAFRDHHRQPRQMLSHDWVEVNREPALAATVVLLFAAAPGPQGFLALHPLLYAAFLSMACVGAAANQLHRWAHSVDRPAWVRSLQRSGLVLSRERHARHHRAAHTDAYCISIGWMNPLLDGVGFWRWLERAVTRAFGAAPRTGREAELLASSAAEGLPRAAREIERRDLRPART